MAPGSLKRRMVVSAQARARRVGTSHLSPPIRIALTASQVVALLLCVLVLTGWRGPAVLIELTGTTYWPLQSLVTMVALGLVAVNLSVGAARSPLARRLLLAAAVLVLTLLAVDALPLDSDRPWWACGAIACAVGGLMLPATRPAWEGIRCVIVFLPFAGAAVATMRSTDVDQALAAIRASQLEPSAALGLAMLSIFAAASATEEYRERSEGLLTWRITTSAVVVAVVIKLALLSALYLRLTGDFLGGETFWRPRVDQPVSWAHAAIVAGVIAFVAVASRSRRSVSSGGFTPRLAILALCLGVMQATALFTLVMIIILSVAAPTFDTTGLFAIPNWVIDHVAIVQLVSVVVLVASALVTLAARRRLTTGTYLWLVAGIWLIPPLMGIAFARDDSPTAWAAPGQVDMILTILVLAMVITRRPGQVSPRTLMSLIVIPVVVLHLQSFWPDSWTQSLTGVAVIGAVAMALWVNPPPVYADRNRNERARALLIAGNITILTLYIYLLNDADLTGGLGTSATIAWLWLGVPITAVLTAQVSRPAR